MKDYILTPSREFNILILGTLVGGWNSAVGLMVTTACFSLYKNVNEIVFNIQYKIWKSL
jgi:hypothetical protein